MYGKNESGRHCQVNTQSRCLTIPNIALRALPTTQTIAIGYSILEPSPCP